MDCNAGLIAVGFGGVADFVCVDGAVFKFDAVGDALHVFLGDVLVGPHVIYFLFDVFRMGEFRSEVAVVGQQQHACGVAVEAPNRVDALGAGSLHQIHHCGAAVGVVAGGHAVLGFVEQYVALAFQGHNLFIVFNNVGVRDFGAELGYYLAVDFHQSLLDEFVGLTARAYTGVAHKFVQTDLFVRVRNGHFVLYALGTRHKALAAVGHAVLLLVVVVGLAVLVVIATLAVVISTLTVLVVVATLAVVISALTVLIVVAVLTVLVVVATLAVVISVLTVLVVVATLAVVISTLTVLVVVAALTVVISALRTVLAIGTRLVLAWLVAALILLTAVLAIGYTFARSFGIVVVASLVACAVGLLAVLVVVAALTVVSALRTVLAIGARLVLARLVGALCAAFGIAVVLAVIINTFVTRCASFGGAVSCRRGYMRDSGAFGLLFSSAFRLLGAVVNAVHDSEVFE